MKSLQERVELLEQKDAQNKTTADFLLCSLKSLLSEITKYRAKNSDDERILAFLDDLQEQQKRENEKGTSTAVSKAARELPSPNSDENMTVNTSIEVQPHTQENEKVMWNIGSWNAPSLTNSWDSPRKSNRCRYHR